MACSTSSTASTSARLGRQTTESSWDIQPCLPGPLPRQRLGATYFEDLGAEVLVCFWWSIIAAWKHIVLA